MKFVLVNTAYRGDTETVEERYACDNHEWLESKRLCDAFIWDDFDSIVTYIERRKINDHKIVSITEEKLFTARLKGK